MAAKKATVLRLTERVIRLARKQCRETIDIDARGNTIQCLNKLRTVTVQKTGKGKPKVLKVECLCGKCSTGEFAVLYDTKEFRGLTRAHSRA